MAVVKWTQVETPHDGAKVRLVKWTGLGASDTGEPVNVLAYSDKTVQIEGTDLTSGITIQGTLDKDQTSYRTLNDPQGNAISAVTTAKIENILEHCYWVRPSCGASVSGGTVYVLLASTR